MPILPRSFMFFVPLAVAFAQPATIATARIGFAYDARLGTIRPIRGIPGAATLGDAIVPGNLAAAAISPRQDYALVQSGEKRSLYLVKLNGQTTDLSSVPGAMPEVDRMIFSVTGRSAALYSNASHRLQILSGFDSVLEVRDVANPALAAPPAAIAVSDDGQMVALASADADREEILWLERGGPQSALPIPAAALAFGRDGSRLLAVTGNGDVLAIRKSGPDFDIQSVYAGNGQTAEPIGTAFAPGEQRAVAVNASGAVTVIDLATGSVNTLSCRCRPSTLESQETETLFRLNQISNLPVMLLDLSSPEPRLWFVPADPPLAELSIADSARSRQ